HAPAPRRHTVPPRRSSDLKPADTPATPENIEAAYKLSLAAAAEYEFRTGKDEAEKPLDLIREPKLKWSNPAMSDVQGNVFVWTRSEEHTSELQSLAYLVCR